MSGVQSCALPISIPVPTDVQHPVIGYRTVVDGIHTLYEVDGDAIGDDRAVTLPSTSATVEELMAALNRTAAGRTLGSLDVKPDPFIMDIVKTWPKAASADRAVRLGLPQDGSLDAIVKAFIEDYVDV